MTNHRAFLIFQIKIVALYTHRAPMDGNLILSITSFFHNKQNRLKTKQAWHP